MSSTEEAAWLVARSDSERQHFGRMSYTDDTHPAAAGPDGPMEGSQPTNMSAHLSAPDVGEAAPDTDSGELLDAGDCSAVEQFHEDALRQAGCGLSQARVVLACALCTAGAALELSAIPFILPSAEIELCILPHEKNWLALISLVGCAVGAAWWGGVAARLGPRRALLSALAVNAVFAAVAAFMPTIGTFLMARFCSAIGSGGIVPTTWTYVSEVTVRSRRRAALAALVAALGAGAAAAAALARAALPLTGAAALRENSEHFSAWHRYLLLCTLPILASLVSLIWTPESPRFLLEVGREVDAMTVYQSIHSGNQVRLCGGASVSAASYRLSELALPAKPRADTHHHPRHPLDMYGLAIFQLFSSKYRRNTLCLGGVLLFSMAIQFYLASYVPATVLDAESRIFEASKKLIENTTELGTHYNRTLENVQYTNVTFVNCTFSDMLLSHVAFKNCSFFDVAFLNIKTSYTIFGGCLFFNSTIIDTDMEVGRQLDQWCVLNGTVIRGMQPVCSRADLTSTLAHRHLEQNYVAYATLIAAVLALFPPKFRPLVALCGTCVLLSPSIYFAQSETALYVVEAVWRVFLVLIFFTVGSRQALDFPSSLRCVSHGAMLSASFACAALVSGAGGGAAGGGGAGPVTSCIVCSLFAVAATALAARAR